MLLADPHLALAADVLDDLERTRIANENRLRQMTRTEADSDGEERGLGLTETHPSVVQQQAIVDAIAALEHKASLELARRMRAHPLGPWIKATPGVGEKQGARLLASIGDPYWHMNQNRPRTVSELWAYCGLHTVESDEGQVAARRRKGVKSNWSTNAKTRAYLVAVSCLKKADSPYRAAYLERRARTAITHVDWAPIHGHNDGLRIASKTLLRDLWREAKRLHDEVSPTA